MLLKSSFVKWVPLLIFQKYISVHFLQIHKPLDSIILKCSEMSIDQILMKPLWSSLIWPEVSQKSPTHISRALLFPALLCCLIWLLSTIVDEVDRMLGVGPEIFEDPEDFVKTGKQPFDHDDPFYIIITYSCFTECMIYFEWKPC